MNGHRIKSTKDPYWKEAWKIYQASFPKGERRQLADQVRTLQDHRYFCMAILKETLVAGILFYWRIEGFCFIEHLAIHEDCKGNGMGTRVLEKMKQLPGRLVLEIDPPEDFVSIRRRKFYERSGFVLNAHEHVNLPLRIGFEELPLRVMTVELPLSREEYRVFNGILMMDLIQYGEAYREMGA